LEAIPINAYLNAGSILSYKNAAPNLHPPAPHHFDKPVVVMVFSG